VKARGTDLSYLPFIIKALCTTLKEHPFLNASLDDAAQEIVFHKVYNLGIAVATDHGLTVPVIHGADQKNLVELASELADKSDRARRLKLTKEDFGGSTFTITSLGKVGGVLATPILNPGEVAILGIHAMRISPKWDEAKATFVPRETMNVSLSFDHRVVDGFTGATGVQRLKELLETPELMMLEMR
jgi:pyruvate dehydrogenase E2 component (dihydrolipoamide acetyltransferase)